jgi:V/A-type H+-transporting ATPase subunit E
MADELQGLLNRIRKEGLEQAAGEKEDILRQAKAEAKATIDQAKSEAERLVAAARQEAKLLREKGEQSLKQAARDVLLSLRDQLENRVVEVARSLAGEACSPATVAEIVATLASSYLEAEQEGRLELQIPPAQAEALRAALAARLGQDLAERCDLAPVPGLGAGFRLVFSGQDIAYDFSDASLAETMASFLTPRLAAMVVGVAAKES